MEVTQETVKAIFNSIDIEGRGYLDVDGIVSLCIELGIPSTQDHAKHIINTAGNEKLSQIKFEEFYLWFKYKHQNDAGSLVKLNKKYSNQLQKWHSKAQKKIGNLFEQKFEKGQNEVIVNVKVGAFDVPKYELGVELRGGLEHKQFISTLVNLFPAIGENQLSLIFSIKTKNPQLVQEKLKEFIEASIDLTSTFMDGNKAALFDMVKNALQFDYVTTVDQVLVRVHGQHEVLDSSIAQATNLINLFITQQFSLHVGVKIETKAGFDDVIAQQTEPILNILNQGFKIGLDAKINSECVEALRSQFYSVYAQKLGEQQDTETKKLRDVALLVLFQSGKLNLNFNSCESVGIDLVVLQDLIEVLAVTVEQLLEKMQGKGVQEMLKNIPFIADFVEVLKCECIGKFALTLIQKDSSVQLYQNCETLGLFWDQLVS